MYARISSMPCMRRMTTSAQPGEAIAARRPDLPARWQLSTADFQVAARAVSLRVWPRSSRTWTVLLRAASPHRGRTGRGCAAVPTSRKRHRQAIQSAWKIPADQPSGLQAFGDPHRRQGATVPLSLRGRTTVTVPLRLLQAAVLAFRPVPDHKNESTREMKFSATSQQG
jgi:hypothetical protein